MVEQTGVEYRQGLEVMWVMLRGWKNGWGVEMGGVG